MSGVVGPQWEGGGGGSGRDGTGGVVLSGEGRDSGRACVSHWCSWFVSLRCGSVSY